MTLIGEFQAAHADLPDDFSRTDAALLYGVAHWLRRAWKVRGGHTPEQWELRRELLIAAASLKFDLMHSRPTREELHRMAVIGHAEFSTYAGEHPVFRVLDRERVAGLVVLLAPEASPPC